MNKKLTIATNYDDWEGLYVDGILYTEGHKLRVEDIFSALGITCEEVSVAGYLETYGSLPSKFHDLEIDE